MALTTTRLTLPYPEPNDTVDVPRDVLALANRLDIIAAREAGAPAAAVAVSDVGVLNQIRAGRQLAAADFTVLGLGAPAGLWNLSNVNDSSGSARTLTNKGTVPFGVGINGLATTAAQFAGSTAQALYRADTGAADPFRILTGSWGCWFRTAKRNVAQQLLSKWGASGAQSWCVYVDPAGNRVTVGVSTNGTNYLTPFGGSDVADDRWHHAVGTYDGTTARVYVDGVLEAAATGLMSDSSAATSLFATAAPLNIGGAAADAGTVTTNPAYGRVDEAFVTADILSDEQVRNLYCAKIAHGYTTTPVRVNLNVRRRLRGGTLATTDFPTTPLRLHNFTAAALTDQGSNGVVLTSNPGTGAIVSVASSDGTQGGAYSFAGAHTGLSSTDAGLPAALTARSYGAWFKTGSPSVSSGAVLAWGTVGTADARAYISTPGVLFAVSGADSITGPYVMDGQWHFLVVTEDNAAGDGLKRKLYVDGRVVGVSTVLNTLTLAGANRFRVGASADGTNPFIGQIDGAFVAGYALTTDQVTAIFNKASQAMAPSPKNAGDHVEAMDATNLLVTFDTLDGQNTIDLGVAA